MRIQATEKEVRRMLRLGGTMHEEQEIPEHMEEFLSDFARNKTVCGQLPDYYFEHIVNHLNLSNIYIRFTPNTLSIYNNNCVPISQNSQLHTFNINLDSDFIEMLKGTGENGMWDWQTDTFRESSEYESVEFYELYLTNVSDNTRWCHGNAPVHFASNLGRFIGRCYPTINSVMLCDLTHDPKGVDVLIEVLEQLVTHGLIGQRTSKELPEKKKKSKKIKLPKISLGADPEFEVLSRTGYVISMREHGSPYSGIVTEVDTSICEDCGDCDGEDFEQCRRDRSEAARYAPVGVDDAGHMVEFRPKPASTPTEIVRNIKELFEGVDASAVFSARGDVYPLGGHIHVGFDVNMPVHPTSNLLRLLDHFIGNPTRKMSGDARGHYNNLSAFETKPYGFEYRTPPAAIFAHPNMVYVTMKIVKQIVKRYLNCELFELQDYSLTLDELRKYAKLTVSQAKFYMKFIEKYRLESTYQDNLACTWNRNAKPIKLDKVDKFRISFGDDWHPAIRNRIINELEKIEVPMGRQPIRIRLYGLNSERGDVVAGINSPINERIDHPQGSNVPFRVRIGLPYTFRIGQYCQDAQNTLIAIIVNKVSTII